MSGFKRQLLFCFLLGLVFPAFAQQPADYESNQSIWLLNSNNKFASSLDSVIDRSFFEAQTITIQSLEAIPLDATYECYAYDIRTIYPNHYPLMIESFTGPQLDPKVVKQILLSRPETLFLLRVLGNKEGDEYKFVGTMTFQLKGEPKQAKESQKRKKEKWVLINSNGKKIRPQDTVVSIKYFQTDWVDLSYGNIPDSNQICSVIIQLPDEGSMRWIKVYGTRLPEAARKMIAKEVKGSKVYFINEPPNQTRSLIIKITLDD